MARERASRQATAAGRGRRRLSPGDIRDLITLMRQSDIAEITVEVSAETRLTLRKPQPLAPEAVAHAGFVEPATRERGAPDTQPAHVPPAENTVAVKTPF